MNWNKQNDNLLLVISKKYHIFVIHSTDHNKNPNLTNINQKDMEHQNYSIMREDRQLLMITHLSQLLDFITGIGGFIVPLIIWLTQKERVLGMDEHGKMVMNFQLSLFIYSIISIPFIILFGLGIFFLAVIWILGLVFPIINAIKVSNGEQPNYPLSIQFFK